MSSSGDKERLFEAVREIERERGSRIWCVVHNHPNAHICGPTLAAVLDAREDVGQGDKVELLLHSGGGHPDVAYRVMKFFRRRFKEVNVIVPLWAKSAATLMCFAADRVYMGELADLGPVDIQLDDPVEHGEKQFSPLDEFKSLEFLREQALEWMDYYAAVMNRRYGMSIKEALKDSIPLVTAVMRPVFEQIDPVEMGEYRRALAMGEDYAQRMLELSGNEGAREIAERFVWDYASHDFCIDLEEAANSGLPVEQLPAKQDKLLTDAILAFRGRAYGFVPQLPSQSKTTTEPASEPLRQVNDAPREDVGTRVNGSNGSGPAERVGAPSTDVQATELPTEGD